MTEIGEVLQVDVSRPAHGGWCVAKPGGQVFFVAGALPGERVSIEVTDVGRRFGRARVVDVLTPSPDRVPHVWPQAQRDGVGGADLGHVALGAQREWKRAVVAEQLSRLAGVQWDGTVEPAPGDAERGGLGWRTRVDVVSDGAGRLGMRAARSHRIVPLSDMPLASERIRTARPFDRRWEPGRRYRLLAASDPALAAVDLGPDRHAGGADGGAQSDGGAWPKLDGGAQSDGETRSEWRGRRDDGSPTRPHAGGEAGTVDGLGPPAGFDLRGAFDPITEHVSLPAYPGGDGATYRLAAGGFWQVHREAPALLAGEVLAAASGATGADGCVWDLFSGAGLFSVPLARLVGAGGDLLAVEGDRAAVEWAKANLAADREARGAARARVQRGDVARALRQVVGPASGKRGRHTRPDVIVLDPPRAGAGLALTRLIAAQRAARIIYVACDPAALARDLAEFLAAGYQLASLRAFDLFPHTHHVESIAVLDGS